nr:probable F-actin-capping protein subunit beta [Tanacetum cinerariifolium]
MVLYFVRDDVPAVLAIPVLSLFLLSLLLIRMTLSSSQAIKNIQVMKNIPVMMRRMIFQTILVFAVLCINKVIVSKATIGLLDDIETNKHSHTYLDLVGTVEQVNMAEETHPRKSPEDLHERLLSNNSDATNCLWFLRVLGFERAHIVGMKMKSGAWIQVNPNPPRGGKEWESSEPLWSSISWLLRISVVLIRCFVWQPMESFDAGNDFKEPTCAELIGGKDSGEGSEPTRSKLTEEAEHKKSGDAGKGKEVASAKLSDSSLIDSFRRPPRGGVEEEQLLGLIDNVDSVILSNFNDRWVWSLESSGEFSVKTARSHIDDFFFPSVGDPTRWIKIVSIMINIFAWKVRLDRLPTRIMYYEGGISSVYLWEEDDNEGFVACFLIKKDGSKYAHGKRGYLHEGGWEAIHVIQVGPDEEGMAHYCLTSTIMLSLTTDSDTSGTFNLSGSIRRQ